MLKILDICSHPHSAYRLLRTRVEKINRHDSIKNYIACPHSPEIEKIRQMGIPTAPFTMVSEIKPFKVPKEIFVFLKLFEKLQPDIIHSHNSKAGAITRIAAFFYNKKHPEKRMIVIHQIHGFGFTRFKGLKSFILNFLERKFANMSDYVLFQNNHEITLAKKYGYGKKAKLFKIGNGISFDEFEGVTRSKEKNRPIKKIICIARFKPVKNHKMIFQALAFLKNRLNYSLFICYFIGEGDSSHYISFIKENNLEQNIDITGEISRDEIKEYIASADLKVLPSIDESKPRALMEAMYVGIPGIGTNVIGINEVISDGENGFLVKLNDYEALAKKIKILLEDEKLNSSMGKAARLYSKDHFNEDIVIEKLISLYKTGDIKA